MKSPAFHSINGQIYWRTTKLSKSDARRLHGMFRDVHRAAAEANDDIARIAAFDLACDVFDAMRAQVNQLARIA